MKTIFAVLSFTLFFQTQVFAHDTFLGDSGIKGPPYQTLIDQFAKLQNDHADYVEVVQYGQSLKGLPLVGIKIFNKSVTPPAQPKTIFIGGTIHGDEYLNVEDRLPEWIVTEGIKSQVFQKFFAAGGMFLFVPIINPDGYSDRERGNANGVDLNRDFTIKRENYIRFRETETRALGEWVKKETYLLNRPLSMTLDYHCCIGAMLRPWSFSRGGPLPAEDEAQYADLKKIFYQSFSTAYQYGRTPDILGYSAVGTSKDYYYEAYHALSFTFEGKYGVENKNFAAHTQMWTNFVNFLNQPTKTSKRFQTLF